MLHLATALLVATLGAEGAPVNVWTGADPSGACKGTRVVQTTGGKVFACVAGTWVDRSDTGTPYDLLFSFRGLMANGQVLSRIVVPRAFTVPAGCPGSQAKPGTNPAAPAQVTVRRNGATVATISIATDGTATFTCADPVTWAAGDVLTVNGPATADAALADLALTISGVM